MKRLTQICLALGFCIGAIAAPIKAHAQDDQPPPHVSELATPTHATNPPLEQHARPSQTVQLLRELGVVFLVLGAMLIGLWFISGCPRHLNIRRTLFVSNFILVCLLVSIATFAIMLLDTTRQQTQV